MKKIFLFIVLAGVSLFARAAEPEALYFTLSDASVVTVLLDDIREITFDETATEMTIHKLDNSDVVIVLDNLEEGSFDPETPNALQSILFEQTEIQKVIEDGQLYIIKDGVRYNVLGIRVK